MTVQIKRKLFTVEDYYKLDEVGIIKDSEKVELIGGEIIARSPLRK